MGFTDWLTRQTKKGLVPLEEDKRDYNKHYSDYYLQYIDPNAFNKTAASVPSATTVTTGGTLTQQDMNNAYKQMYTNSTGTYTGSSWNNWTDDEKKLLAKIGFEYDKKKKDWVLKISTEVRLEQSEGFQLLMQGARDKPSQQAVAKIKQLKEKLIEKLTAKMILSELIKPREVKE